MTPKQTLELAKQAGFYTSDDPLVVATESHNLLSELHRFAELVRNQMLDEVAKSCNELIEADNSDDYKAGVTWCAMRIEGLKS